LCLGSRLKEIEEIAILLEPLFDICTETVETITALGLLAIKLSSRDSSSSHRSYRGAPNAPKPVLSAQYFNGGRVDNPAGDASLHDKITLFLWQRMSRQGWVTQLWRWSGHGEYSSHCSEVISKLSIK
jgi:hypothetical protein